jgi:CheY-like chemotaxis protein/nitrogen-specific signal transduction histidine kinase
LRAARHRIAALEGRLAETTRSLDEARAEALAERERVEEAHRAKSVFLSNMSHELRTPLNAVLGFAQLLDRNPALGPQDRENLAAIMRGGEHLLGFVNDVLSLSRLEAGHHTISIRPYDLVRLLRGVEDVIRARAEAKGLRLDVVHGPELPECVRGDEDKLRQVLMHLLGNAVDFTDTGGVTFRASWDGRAGGGVATFEVEDTGRGIAPADMGVLFEAFVQAQSGLRSSEGVGLGLALSRNLVLLMDGDIFASSELGKGTVFTVQVPLPADPCVCGDEERRVVGLEEAGAEPIRILVVDDVREDRALLAGRLRAVGFEVREAENGREAVDMWRAWRPQLVWMDTRMRVMDGYEATRLIRAADGGGCKIVALATIAFAHEREVALASGADDFRVKPLTEREVFAVVAEKLGVRYVYAAASAAAELEGAATPERLALQPRRVLVQLSRALTIGDDRTAQDIVDWIGREDPGLAGALGQMLRNFHFDRIARLIESIPPESR